MQPGSKTLVEIRSDVCDATLLWLSAFALPALAFSLLRIVEHGWLPVMGVHIAVVTVLAVLALARRRVPYPVRATTVVVVSFLVGIGGHLTFGSSPALVFFISGSIMAAVFFGERIGIVCLALSAAIIMAIYFAFAAGLLPEPEFGRYAMSPTAWISNTGGAMASAIGPLIAVSRFRRYLDLERRRAEAASAAKSDFLAMMSHELRTPMTAILGLADLLMADRLAPEQHGRVERIVNSGRLLLGLLNDVLDFSKIEANRLEIERIPFSPRDLVNELYESHLPLAKKKNLELRVDIAPGLNDALIGDPARITQVLQNLINNAIKFTEHGRVAVHVSQADSALGVTLLRVEVADTGIGLTPAQQAGLFRPFTQANAGVSRRYGGTGLGLAISRRLVELMGGDIAVSSREGEGAVFSFNVPVLPDRAAKVTNRTDVPPPARHDAPALRLLVAEDNEATQYLLTTMLTRWGHAVECVENGALAVAAVQARSFDAVLMDIQMPVMDGTAATRAIRGLSGAIAGIPILALTADIASGHRDSYMAAGMNAIMGKPVDWGELAMWLDRLGGTALAAKAADPAQVLPQAGTPPDLARDEMERDETVLDEAALAEMIDVLGAENLDRMLVTFCENLATYRVDLAAAFDAGNMAQVRRTAHALKGLSLQFGAPRVAALAASLEQNAGIPGKTPPAMDEVARELAKAEQAFAARAARGPT